VAWQVLNGGMKDFDEFKASREKMDPSARKMTEHQWKRAYEAYCRTRERRRSGGRRRSSSEVRENAETGSERRSVRGADRRSLRDLVRQESAYSDLRGVVDLLSWIALGIIAVDFLSIFFQQIPQAAFFSALLASGLKAISVVALRMLAHVVVDIPDVALYRMTVPSGRTSEVTEAEH